MNKLNIYHACLIYCLALVFYTVYSYTQVDLNLTLSAIEIYQEFQSRLIYLGYFNRPLSAFIYVLILIFLFTAYFLFLRRSNVTSSLMKKLVYMLFPFLTIAGLFSYPAFSHDIFNYMFDARIVTLYHLNPYTHKALDFPSDLWTRFMRWTHRTYPYGPLWLIISLPFSYAGMAKFVPTLLLFKLMFIIVYFLNVYFIYMLNRTGTEKTGFRNSAFFALNPLVITETLVSPHNESIMLFFLLISLLFLLKRDSLVKSLVFLTASVFIKFATVTLIPAYFLKDKFKNRTAFLKWLSLFLILPVLYLIIQREAYPWYFIPFIGLASLIPWGKFHHWTIMLSAGLMLRYLPFIYYGTYTDQTAQLTNVLTFLPPAIYLIYYLFNKFPKKAPRRLK